VDFYARQTVKRAETPSAFLSNKLHMSILHFQFKFFALTTPGIPHGERKAKQAGEN